MHFHKFPHHENFEFIQSLDASGSFRSGRTKRTLSQYEVAPDVFRLTVKGGSWNKNESGWAHYPDGIPEGKTRTIMKRVGKRPEFR